MDQVTQGLRVMVRVWIPGLRPLEGSVKRRVHDNSACYMENGREKR